MYRTPDAAVLSKLVEKLGEGRVRYWVSMVGRIANNELPRAKRVMESVRRGSGAGGSAEYSHSSPELVVTDMFVQPLVMLGMTSKLLLPKVKAPKRR